MAERAAKTAWRRLVLVRPSGLRVCRSGPLLATVPLDGPVPVAGPDGARSVAGTTPPRRAPLALGPVSYQQPGHRLVLRRRSGHLETDALGNGRILALVGGPLVGRGLLRGVCHGGHCFFVQPPATDPYKHGNLGKSIFDKYLPGRRHHWHLPPSIFRWHAQCDHGSGSDVQRSGGGAVGADRF